MRGSPTYTHIHCIAMGALSHFHEGELHKGEEKARLLHEVLNLLFERRREDEDEENKFATENGAKTR